jgi:hypothetical protein
MKRTLVFLAGSMVLASVGLWCLQADDHNGVACLKADPGRARSLVRWVPVRESSDEGFRATKLQSGKAIGYPTSLTDAPRVVAVVHTTTTVYLVQAPGDSVAGFGLSRAADRLENLGNDRNPVVSLPDQPGARGIHAVVRTIIDSPHATVPKHISAPWPADANIGRLRHLDYDY